MTATGPLCVALALVTLAACTAGPDDGDRAALDAGDDVAEPAPAPTPLPATATPRPAGEPPERWVAHTEDHRLVVKDRDDGEELVVLGAFDDPGEAGGEGFAAGLFLGAFTVSPDGQTVYYETCCEPAPGTIWRVPIDGGEPERVADGAWPALDVTGDQLAAVHLQWLGVWHLANGTEPRLDLPTDDPDPPVMLRQPAWGPDGVEIVVERHDDEGFALHRLDLRSAADGADTAPVAGSEGLTLPAFDALGGLHAVRQEWPAGVSDPTGPAQGLRFDRDDQEWVETRAYPGGVRSHVFDATGAYAIVALADGRALWMGPDGDGTVLDDGVLAAAW